MSDEELDHYPGANRAERRREWARSQQILADKAANIGPIRIQNSTESIVNYWPGQGSAVVPGQVVEVPPPHRARILREHAEIQAKGQRYHGRTGRPLPPPFVLDPKDADGNPLPVQTAAQVEAEERRIIEAAARPRGE